MATPDSNRSTLGLPPTFEELRQLPLGTCPKCKQPTDQTNEHYNDGDTGHLEGYCQACDFAWWYDTTPEDGDGGFRCDGCGTEEWPGTSYCRTLAEEFAVRETADCDDCRVTWTKLFRVTGYGYNAW